MNTSDMLGILGIVATIIFGVWGIIIVIRRRYPGQLTYVKESYIGLFDSIVKNVPELSVLYKNEPVGQGLVLITGAILNTGSKDITETMVEQKLAFVLPAGFRWLTAKVAGNSGNVIAKIAIQDNNSLVFSTGLFRCNEFIRIQAIAELPVENIVPGKVPETIEDRLEKAISITHRIADTQKVSKIELPTKTRISRYIQMSIALLVVCIVFCTSILYEGIPAETHFFINDTKGITHEVTITTRLDGNVSVKGAKDNFREQIPIEDFYRLQMLKPKAVFSNKIKLVAVLLFLFYVIGPLTFCILAYREHKRANKLRIMLGIEDSK